MRLSSRWLLICIAAIVIAAGAACGGGNTTSRNAGGKATESSQASADPTGKRSEDVDETRLAESLLLTIADFPSGWAEEPSEPNDEGPLDECIGQDPDRTGRAETGDFSEGDSFSISHTVTVFFSEDAAREALADIRRVGECAVRLINEGEADDDEVKFSDASLSPLSFSPKGDESAAYRMKAHAQLRGQEGLGSEADLYIDVVYILVGRIAISVQASDVLAAPDPDDWEPFVDIAVARAERGKAVP